MMRAKHGQGSSARRNCTIMVLPGAPIVGRLKPFNAKSVTWQVKPECTTFAW
jgi:hypothetical protein